MKKLLLLLIIPFLSFGQEMTYVPDDNLEQALIDLGFDDYVCCPSALDDSVLTENIENLGLLDIGYLDIYDLTGIEDFTSLQYLNFPGNPISEIDLSNNINLTSINCTSSNLVELDLSTLANLETLVIHGNNQS